MRKLLDLLWMSGIAWSQTTAGELVDQAMAARSRGEFEEAARLLLRAQAIDPDPVHAYNTARVYDDWAGTATSEDQEGEGLEKAIEQYDRFLAREQKDADLIAKARQKREEASERVAAIRSARWQRRGGWASVALGAVSTGVGIAFGVVASSKASDLEKAEAAGGAYSETGADPREDGERAEKIQIVGLAVGGAALVVGTVLLLKNWNSSRSRPAVTTTPTVLGVTF